MKENSLDNYIYLALIIACIVLCFILLIIPHFFNLSLISHCFIFEHFGIYCPGCGCTRAFEAILQGDILQSVYYNPAVLYTIMMLSIYLITQTIQRILKHTYLIMPYSHIYLYIGICILLLNCLIRNILLLVLHISL